MFKGFYFSFHCQCLSNKKHSSIHLYFILVEAEISESDIPKPGYIQPKLSAPDSPRDELFWWSVLLRITWVKPNTFSGALWFIGWCGESPLPGRLEEMLTDEWHQIRCHSASVFLGWGDKVSAYEGGLEWLTWQGWNQILPKTSL